MYFKDNRKVIRWPKKYSDVVNILSSLKEDNSHEEPYLPLYKLNAGILIAAAAIGLEKGIEEEVSTISGETNEIRTDTFDSNAFGQIKLSYYIALIVFLYTKDKEIIRDDRDDELIKIFQKLAAGGLSYLKGSFFDRENTDRTGRNVILNEISNSLRKIN
jgi:hypothetical protein